MRSSSLLRLLLIVSATLAGATVAGAQESASVAAGRTVAQRHCATCHAIDVGESPMKDAPAFAKLRYRYGAGGLAELLQKGMIKDWPRPLEEGARPMHPRMPAFPLDEDEVVVLVDYLRSLEKHSVKSGEPPHRR